MTILKGVVRTVSMDGVTNDYIGAMCAQYRKVNLKVSQQKVADCCGVSRELVSKFERGILPNSLVFLWYIKMGIFDWVPYNKWCGWQGCFDYSD